MSAGLLVVEVTPGSAASAAGLRGGTTQFTYEGEAYVLGGDVLVEAEGVALVSPTQLPDIVAEKHPGDTLELVLYRGDEKMVVEVTLGRYAPLEAPTDEQVRAGVAQTQAELASAKQTIKTAKQLVVQAHAYAAQAQEACDRA